MQPAAMPEVVADWDQVPILLTFDQTARVLGISRSSVYALRDRGELRVKRIGARVFVSKVELRRFVEGGS